MKLLSTVFWFTFHYVHRLSGIASLNRRPYHEIESELPHWHLNSFEFCRKLPRPRYINSHLPFNLLPRQITTDKIKPKIIHICRNPKDVFISLYYHKKLVADYCGSFEQFCELFLAGRGKSLILKFYLSINNLFN